MSPTKRSGERRAAGGKATPLSDALAAASPALARALYSAVAYTSYTPLSMDAVRARLAAVADQIIAALVAPEYQPTGAREAGAAVVALQFTQPEALGRMQAAIVEWLLASIPAAQVGGLQDRLPRVIGDIATGFAAAARDAILSQQEQTRAALLVAEHRAQAAEDARAAAEAMVRVRTEVLHAAAHDLRSPVTSILGHAELLQMQLRREPLPPAARLGSHVAAISASGKRIRVMIEELLDAARIQAGQALELQLEPVDVGELVRELARARPPVAGGEPRVLVDASPDLIVEGDRARLERALENVVDNAIKYSNESTPVRIVARLYGDEVALSVQDRGVGIPTEELPRLFMPFYRATTARGTPGIGLGLAGARAVVEQHGGRIAVESIVDEGTTVTITLPRAPGALDSTPTGG